MQHIQLRRNAQRHTRKSRYLQGIVHRLALVPSSGTKIDLLQGEENRFLTLDGLIASGQESVLCKKCLPTKQSTALTCMVEYTGQMSRCTRVCLTHIACGGTHLRKTTSSCVCFRNLLNFNTTFLFLCNLLAHTGQLRFQED